MVIIDSKRLHSIDLTGSDRKQKIIAQKKIEEELQKRLRKESNISQIDQSLIVINRNIDGLTVRKDSFNLNANYEEELFALNQIKSEINKLSTKLSVMEFRRELIIESKIDLEKEFSKVDSQQIKNLYEEAKILIPNLQRSFEDTLNFHNQMIEEKIEYITEASPTSNKLYNLINQIIFYFRKEFGHTLIAKLKVE